LVEIIKVLGTPTREQIREMNPNYTEFKFPQIKAHPWSKVFRPRTPVEAITLVSRLLEYTPGARVTPLEACAHGFFDELRDPKTRLPNGRDLPPLFNWTQTELSIASNLNSILVPPHATGIAAASAGGTTASGSSQQGESPVASADASAAANATGATGPGNGNNSNSTSSNQVYVHLGGGAAAGGGLAPVTSNEEGVSSEGASGNAGASNDANAVTASSAGNS